MLYIVATPIGNLDDMTFRGVEVLKNVNKVYCEDTRRTRVLCERFKITTPLESFHHYSTGKIGRIVERLVEGEEYAYVSDAGTPGVQDPGSLLVSAAREAGVKVIPIPGASALGAIISVAGVPMNRFSFWGFVPTKKGRQTFIKNVINAEEPIVVFETAPRIQKLLREMAELGGADKQVVLGRELTKQFEQIAAGSVAELIETEIVTKGEFVLVFYQK